MGHNAAERAAPSKAKKIRKTKLRDEISGGHEQNVAPQWVPRGARLAEAVRACATPRRRACSTTSSS
jgi:hypothetical protein